jgi:transposase-like protein
MAKTRSQTGNIKIKKEEEDSKTTLLLNGVSNTRRSNRIAKRRPPVTNNRHLSAQQVKIEEDTNTKALLKSESSSSNSASRPIVSQEQINQLVHYIVNDNMNITKAARKANMSRGSGFIYHKLYKDDPEKKIPLPRNQTSTMYTQEQVGNLIRYINDDKMTLTEASAKANMLYSSGNYYYAKYLEDPKHSIPTPRLCRYYTKDQKNEFYNYIARDKMSIKAASKKAKMNLYTANNYYHNYFKVQNPDVATPSHIATRKHYTQEKKKELISYIVDDKISIAAASRKADFNPESAAKYYRQYLNDNNMKRTTKHYTQDHISELIRCIIDDKMSIAAASKKANVSITTAYRHYYRYLEDHNIDVPIPKRYTQEQKSELVGYIIDNKMSMSAAAKKAKMGLTTAHRHYYQYLNAQRRNGPTPCPRVDLVGKNK